MSAQPGICFVSMEVYATLRPGVAEEAGGAGFQVVQIARGLRDRGHPVSFVVGDYGQPFHEEIDGFQVYRANRVAYDKSKTRALKNLWRLFRAMRAAGARHYVLRSTRFLAFFVMLYARLLGARYTFMVANLPHCVREELEGLSPTFKRLYEWSLRGAHRVTTQSEEQQALMRKNFGVETPVVPNGIEVPPFAGPKTEAEVDIAWVASVKTAKRPDRLLEVAAALPHRTFRVAGGPGADLEYYEDMKARFEAAPNIDFVGFMPPDRVGEIYESARIFLNTSAWEGFPNTFLYSWTRGIPACSNEIDPDGILSEGGLGIVDIDPASLARRMDELLDDPDRYADMCRRCHEHVSATHSLDHTVDVFETVLPE